MGLATEIDCNLRTHANLNSLHPNYPLRHVAWKPHQNYRHAEPLLAHWITSNCSGIQDNWPMQPNCYSKPALTIRRRGRNLTRTTRKWKLALPLPHAACMTTLCMQAIAIHRQDLVKTLLTGATTGNEIPQQLGNNPDLINWVRSTLEDITQYKLTGHKQFSHLFHCVGSLSVWCCVSRCRLSIGCSAVCA